MRENNIVVELKIQNKIYTICGLQVMLDRDLAELYQVKTKRINEQVKRNIERFPKDFMFQLAKDELEIWKSQNATTPNSIKMGLRKSPLAFTKQGVYMLATALKGMHRGLFSTPDPLFFNEFVKWHKKFYKENNEI